METEIEVKFLDIDPAAIRETLSRAGATLVQPEVLMRRKTFDHPTQKANDWFRVRDEGDKITLAYKKMVDRTLHGMKEVSVEVSSFDDTCAILAAAHLKLAAYQETRRETWMLDGVEIMIDTWPWIPTFIEVEAPSEEALKAAIQKLGLEESASLYGSVEPVYQKHYDVTEAEVNSWPEIVFGPVPDWLLAKKRKE